MELLVGSANRGQLTPSDGNRILMSTVQLSALRRSSSALQILLLQLIGVRPFKVQYWNENGKRVHQTSEINFRESYQSIYMKFLL